jgi:hypothetical protein
MIYWTSLEVNRERLGACERALKLHPSRKDPTSKRGRKPQLGNSTLEDCRGPNRDLVCLARCSHLVSIPTTLVFCESLEVKFPGATHRFKEVAQHSRSCRDGSRRTAPRRNWQRSVDGLALKFRCNPANGCAVLMDVNASFGYALM